MSEFVTMHHEGLGVYHEFLASQIPVFTAAGWVVRDEPEPELEDEPDAPAPSVGRKQSKSDENTQEG